MLLSESETRCKIPDAMIFHCLLDVFRTFTCYAQVVSLLRLMCTSLSECKSLAVRLHLWVSTVSTGSAPSSNSSNCDVLLHKGATSDRRWKSQHSSGFPGFGHATAAERWRIDRRSGYSFARLTSSRSRPHCFGLLFMPAIWITSFIWSLACQTSASGMSSDRSRARQLRLGCNDCN